jgi:hypothetical protein
MNRPTITALTERVGSNSYATTITIPCVGGSGPDLEVGPFYDTPYEENGSSCVLRTLRALEEAGVIHLNETEAFDDE